VHYFRRWYALFPAILVTGAVFIAWDVYFTYIGIWGFNPTHLSGIYLAGLPIEEWMFFLTVPYASVFIFDCLRYYFPKQPLSGVSQVISIVLMIVLLAAGLASTDKLYTVVTFLSLAVAIGVIHFLFHFPFMGYFYLSFLIILFPFLLVNGVLTGSFIGEEVVWYNNSQNMDVRLFTIPVEDAFYGMLLLLINVFLYMRFLGKTSDKTREQTHSSSLQS
jgi:lycopene cyclase domain-containing protein